METSSDISLHGTITVGDLGRLQYFHVLRRMWPIALLCGLLVLVAAPLLVIAKLAPQPDDTDVSWNNVLTNAAPFIFLLCFWLFLFGIAPWRAARRQFRTQVYLGEPITYVFNPESLSASGPSTSWSMAWTNLKRVHETKSLFLLYHAPNLAAVLPKRFFHDHAEMEQWRRLVSDRISPLRIQSPGVVARWC